MVFIVLVSLSLYHGISHCLNISVSIIWSKTSHVATRDGFFRAASCTKTDTGISTFAIRLLVTNNTNPCFKVHGIALWIETLFVAVKLQGCVCTNQRLPFITTKRNGTILPVSDKWIKGSCLHVSDYEIGVTSDPHTKADLRERFLPVSW